MKLKMTGKIRLEKINDKFFVDYEVVENSWKNFSVCKSRDEAMKNVALLKRHAVDCSA